MAALGFDLRRICFLPSNVLAVGGKANEEKLLNFYIYFENATTDKASTYNNMKNNSFTINNRFVVSPARNLVKDLESGAETRLEPRLVHLLCLLSENQGQVLSREALIREIWNDYGGAEDGLNQAVSSLRKTLRDSERKVIETVPKKGYALQGTINSQGATRASENGNRFALNKYAAAAGAAGLIVIWALLWQQKKTGFSADTAAQKQVAEKPVVNKPTEIDFSALKLPEQENYVNTVTTTGPDHTHYRLVAIGDRRPEFWINNTQATDAEAEKYTVVMDNMLRQLWARQKQYADSLRVSGTP